MPHGFASLHPLTESILRKLGIVSGQVTQGWGTGVAASAGSHDRVGECPDGRKYGLCVDLKYELASRSFFDQLAAHGLCMFVRTPGQDGWPSTQSAHIHCVHVGLRDYAGVKHTLDLPVRQIDSWVAGHNGLVSDYPLLSAWAPNRPQKEFMASLARAWKAPKPVTVLSPESTPIPCFAVVVQDRTRCAVRPFCAYWEAPLAWVGGKLLVTVKGQPQDLTSKVTIEGDTARANLRDLAGALGLGIGAWQENTYEATVQLTYA